MPVTMEQVLHALETIEPNYTDLASLGPDALPHLGLLVEMLDPRMAAKAACLTGFIDDKRSPHILGQAVRNPLAQVRIGAALGARQLRAPAASPLFAALLGDSDSGVRRIALISMPVSVAANMTERLELLSRVDPDMHVRHESGQALRRFRAQVNQS